MLSWISTCSSLKEVLFFPVLIYLVREDFLPPRMFNSWLHFLPGTLGRVSVSYLYLTCILLLSTSPGSKPPPRTSVPGADSPLPVPYGQQRTCPHCAGPAASPRPPPQKVCYWNLAHAKIRLLVSTKVALVHRERLLADALIFKINIWIIKVTF